eukprot:5414452-Pyramimonas_sp.AAC.1
MGGAECRSVGEATAWALDRLRYEFKNVSFAMCGFGHDTIKPTRLMMKCFESDWSGKFDANAKGLAKICLLYTSPSPRDRSLS